MNAAVVFDLPHIRALDPADIEPVFSIERRAYRSGWSRGVLMDCLRNDYVCQGLLTVDRIRGYYFVTVGAGESHLLNLAVDPDFQNRGFGTELLAHALREAAAAGAECVFLEVRPSNDSARLLYARQGFSEFGRRRGYYPTSKWGTPESALVLCRRLP